jgi:S1-C subfamily serine protease
MFRRMKRKNLLRISLAVCVLFLSSIACNFLSDDTEEPTSPPPPTDVPAIQSTEVSQPPTAEQPTQVIEADSVGNTTGELAKATVQIFALWDSGSQWDIVWTGSGSIISQDGFILTNAHVVDNRFGEYSALGIAMTDRTDQPPELVYLAEIINVDYALDLSVIKIVSDMQGNSVTPTLPFIALGDSDQIEIGENIRILGFPGIGGDTITFTEGAVSGFTQERGIDGRAWIKTDATIAGGNSGGMAANSSGALIGVPTQASAGGDQIVDCRPVVDTNRDGYIDQEDSCVPIGGFLNGLRPVNLAKPLIDAALNNQEYASGVDPIEPGGEYNISDVDFSNLIFGDGVIDDMPTQQWYAMPSGSYEICAFWDYEGMEDGMIWSALWFANEELDEGGSILENTWQGGYSGSWWVCMSSEVGLRDGTYELILEVQGETIISDAIFIGGNRSVVDFVLVNESSIDICYVQISASTALGWGQDELGAEEIIFSGENRSFTLATGVYDFRLLDCDGEVVYDNYGLEIFESLTFTLTD